MHPSLRLKFAVGGVALVLSLAAQATTIAQAKRILADRMKDPSSVQFRNVKAFKSGAVCGEYNAKNSFGAYVGFTPFGVDADGLIMDAPELDGLPSSYAQAAMKQFLRECEG